MSLSFTVTESDRTFSFTAAEGVGPRGATGATGAAGTNGTNGSDAEVTNANVAAAIETDPAAIRDAADVVDVTRGPESVAHFWDALADYELSAYPADQKYITIAGAGDSMGTDTGFMPYLIEDLVRKYGQGCVGSTSILLTIGTGQLSTTVVGTASAAAADFTYLPSGDFYTVDAGETVTESPSSPNIHSGFRKIRCFYGIKSGGGTLTFAVAQTGATITDQVVDTSIGTAGTIGYVDFDESDGLLMNGKPVLTVSGSIATSHYLGCIMYLNSGVVPIRLGRGSSSSAQAITGAAANLGTMAAATDLRLVCFASKETDEDETLANLTTLLTRWHDQVTTASFVLVGATPSPSAESDVDPAQNALLRSKAATYGWSFVDGMKLLRSTTYLGTIGTDADGWNESGGTGPHLSTKARRFIASWILDKVLLANRVSAGRFSPLSIEAFNRGLRDTSTRITTWTKNASNYNSSNFSQTTPDYGRFTFSTIATNPVANSGLACQVGYPEIRLNTRCLISYVLTDGYLIDDILAVFLFGGTSQTECTTGQTNTTYSGFRIIHGADVLSGNQVPYIRFAVKGSGTSETVSPKIYHSSATGTAPYNGGTWRASSTNRYWVEYIGNGSSATKRFRAWHQPYSASSTETDVAQRRMIADWSGTVTVGGTFDNKVYYGLVTGASPGAIGAKTIAMSDLVITRPADLTQFNTQDWNF